MKQVGLLTSCQGEPAASRRPMEADFGVKMPECGRLERAEVRGRVRGGGGPMWGFWLSLLLLATLAAPGEAQVRVNITHPAVSMMASPGSMLVVPFMAATTPPLPSSGIMAALDVNIGLPPHARATCKGLPYSASSGGCVASDLAVELNPAGDMGGDVYRICATFTAYNQSVVMGTNRTCTRVTVSPIMPSFTGFYPDGTPPNEHFLFANLGCEFSFNVVAQDTSPACVAGQGGGGGCQVQVSLVPEGASPRGAMSAEGLPAGIKDQGGVAVFERVGGKPGGEERWLFKWTPVRGQESMTPYKVCVRVQDPSGIAQETRCINVLVAKCQMCTQPGDTIGSIAMSMGVDWLHVYTTNPHLKTPDWLEPYSVINTGVLYEVQKGEYVDFIAQKFLTSRKSILLMNPDIAARAKYQVDEGDIVCILPEICQVECSDPNTCKRIDEL